MTDREAMKLALDALENHTAIKHPQQMHYRDTAIEALRQTLEQPDPFSRLVRIMGTFDLSTGHADNWNDLLDSLESELRDVLGYYRETFKVEQECSTHPDAPHGFNRDASHNYGRYVCDCEGWEPPDDDAAWARHLKEPVSEKRVHESDTMERECNPHPDAPHGFNRDASHGLGRYVCDCEGWEPPNVSQEPQTMPEKTDDVAQETQPEQEPVAWLATNNERGGISCLVFKYSEAVQFGDQIESLYTAPPKREFIGLTDDETDILITLHAPPIHPDFNDDDDFIELVSAIEFKLKEKNT